MLTFRKREEKPIVGLDIGTTKVCAVVSITSKDGLEVVGFGAMPSRGIKKGLIISLEDMTQSIREALKEAEATAGCKIDTVYLGIGGKYIKSYNSGGSIILKDKMVKESDIRKVIDIAVTNVIPSGETEIIQIILQEFIVDGQRGIQKPLELVGERLEVKVHVVTVGIPVLIDIIKYLSMSGLNIAGIVPRQLASAEAVLSMDERQLGVILMDIGGETTDIAIYSRGGILRNPFSVPVGGNIITRDIGTVLKIPLSEAERIKIKYGCALTSTIHNDEIVEVMRIDERRAKTFTKKYLAEIIEARVEDFLNLIKGEILKSGFNGLIASGIVITGGSAKLEGMSDITERIFSLPVQIGTPAGIEVMDEALKDPVYATGVGLTLYGKKDREGIWFSEGRYGNNLGYSIGTKIIRWFKEFFVLILY